MQQNPSNTWIPAAEAWKTFSEKHPELGIRATPASWVHFSRVHAKALLDAGVLRRASFRNRIIADANRFDGATFNLLTTGDVNGHEKN